MEGLGRTREICQCSEVVDANPHAWKRIQLLATEMIRMLPLNEEVNQDPIVCRYFHRFGSLQFLARVFQRADNEVAT